MCRSSRLREGGEREEEQVIHANARIAAWSRGLCEDGGKQKCKRAGKPAKREKD